MENKNIPTHVAIIMDGNGRWAKKRAMPRTFGHRQGAQRLVKVAKYASELDIKYLTVFAFSTENWNRPKDEVEYLMKLPIEFLNKYEKSLMKDNIRLKVIGDRTKLNSLVQETINRVELSTKNNTKLTLIIALNYGSQDEIVNAVNYISKNNIEVTKETFKEYLFTKDFPDVDLLIRTSGEYRISNFLLWQIAYAELYFTNTLWPDFSKAEFDKAICSYSKRERRYGGLK